jgi:hypothetical protein
VPTNDCRRLHNDQRAGPVRPDSAQDEPEGAITGLESWSLLVLDVDRELLTEGCVFNSKCGFGYQQASEENTNGYKEGAHDTRLYHTLIIQSRRAVTYFRGVRF